MKKAGINPDYIEVFKNHVNQFNSLDSKGSFLTGDFVTSDSFSPDYDPYAFQDLWKERYPDFLGYNCRITSFGLFRDYLNIDISAEKRDGLLFFDFEALESDNSAVPAKSDLEKFKAIFSYIPTENTKNAGIHAENIKNDWKRRKISFKDNPDVRMISVFFHDNIDEENKLFIGHVGILVRAENGKLYFIEKIAFQEPYQVSIFNSKSELYSFLMKRYDVEENQDTAKPVIFDNDEVIKF